MIAEEVSQQSRGRSLANDRCCLSIGDLLLGFTSRDIGIYLTPDYEVFKVAPVACDIDIKLEWVNALTPFLRKNRFDSAAAWTLHEDADGLIFDFVSPFLGPDPYKRMYIDKDPSCVQVLFSRKCFPDPTKVYPLEYPMDEIIVTNWLSRGRGIEIHSCGLVDADSGSGFLFVGHSGAGKSTTTRLWDTFGDARILSDDRIIVRKQANHFWMYGTPWHGDAGFASPEKTQIKHIFLIEHGKENKIVPLSRTAAIGEMLTRCFLPDYDREALNHTLSFLDDFTRNVPCHRFQFLPDSSAVEKILEFQHSR